MHRKGYSHIHQLSDQLFKIASQNLCLDQIELLKSKWPQIRNIASQNAGFSSWGDHLLKLKPKDLNHLQETFATTIRSIESVNLDLIHSFIEKCPDLFGLRFLLDHTVKLNHIPLNKEAASALFLEYNPTLVAQHRSQFQELFKFLSIHPNWDIRDSLVAQMLIGNLIALLPYFDFEEGSQISLLKLIEGTWKLASYRITHIPLIQNKIIAYGLEPCDRSEVNPLLIFRGTPYPAASGFFDAILSDLHPTKSIGKDIFDKGRYQIDQWMKGKAKVECYGLSLGGALAYHAGNVYGSQVEIHAYGAPGIIPMKGGMKQIHGQVFFHHQDFIKLVGFHPESTHFKIYTLLTEGTLDFVSAHTRPPGIRPTVVLSINPKHENRTTSRYIFNILKTLISIFIYLVLLPIRFGMIVWGKTQKYWKKIRTWF